MSASPEPSAAPASEDPLRHAAPASGDVEARRARASIESRLFSGPPQPVRVGRYQVQGRIGAGGMGVVYRAHDPELVRDVAVKLMNADAEGSGDPSTARARLVREARAMARLAHPHVIHVYDVGTTEDGVFIAMELVEGRNLALWIEQEAPVWRDVLRHYVDAGRGLAAAHAAGVVHRDFKPENVLVGEDGRVRVGDFGLAGGPVSFDQTGSESESELDRESGELHGPSGSLTKTGALLGTPKYMAPEQESGAMASPRSDQFSFCVALYEALYGYPPFAGDSVSEYRHNVKHGRVLDPPPESKVKGWVHAVIVRGLAVDPADRHAELDPLLDRLEEALVDPNVARRRRRRNRVVALLSGSAGLLLLGGVGLWIAGSDGVVTAPPPAQIVARVVETPPPTTDVMLGAGSTGAADVDQGLEGPPLETPVAPKADPMPTPPQTDGTSAGGEPAAPPDPDAEPLPSSTTAPEPSADGDDRPRGTKRRRRGTCYFLEDDWKYLQLKRRHSRFVTGKDGRCYDCQHQMPDYRRDRLMHLHPDCTSRYYQCVQTGEDQCTG